ncbi:ATP-binding protein [Caballeronia sp. LP006]|uniref:ATP-binding protein n=1 Tax=unclassified Caballeronia TaxID=2646786 RepID=UPI00285F2360|nr:MULTISPECIES: ATP-binding protein [unclassified Caballeronia]MDR5802645.1 ATP-binding protein [Caballeronia sp. LZ001]MDR5830703.1 ATP-binding protein [Caballeronia sp. LP006]
MRRAIDTLFGRLVVIVIGMLVLSHVAWFAIIRFERDNVQTRFAVEETAFLVDAVRQHMANTPDQPLPPRVRIFPLNSPEVPRTPDEDTPPPLAHFIEDLKDRLPDGTDVRLNEPGAPPSVWVHGAKDAGWIVVPVQPLRPPRSRDRMLLWLALIFSTAVLAALFGAWQLQYPLRSLAQAVGRFGRGQPTPPVPERGPRELRQLTHGFNQMVREVSQTENDRAVMLAGVAHDLKTPLARLRLRAEMMDDAKVRDGVVRDVDSMAHIVDQFLVFAHDRPDGSEPVSVDQQCEKIARTYRAVSPTAEPVRLDLEAGPNFVLPAATLDRLLSNLLDNAHAYGAAPIVIATRRAAKGWVLTVSDHGKGIAPDDLIKASRPFVRLDPARGGSGHSGLGLAIVERLARRAGGECEVGNQPAGGLQVVMTFPFDVATQPTSERRVGAQHEERASL